MLNGGSRLGCPDIVSAAGTETFVLIISNMMQQLSLGEYLNRWYHCSAQAQGNAGTIRCWVRVMLLNVYSEDILLFLKVQKQLKRADEMKRLHFLEELLYICARADLLCERVKNVKGKICWFDLIVLWKVSERVISSQFSFSVTNSDTSDFQYCLTFPLGRPRSFRAWKIPFSVLPDANVRVML